MCYLFQSASTIHRFQTVSGSARLRSHSVRGENPAQLARQFGSVRPSEVMSRADICRIREISIKWHWESTTDIMSDRRGDAEQDLVSAGMASGMEDSLGVSAQLLTVQTQQYSLPVHGLWVSRMFDQTDVSHQAALGSSFNIPKPNPKSSGAAVDAIKSTEDETSASAAEEPPVPGMDTWKDTYEGYVQQWQSESAEAREKARTNREKYEREADERKMSEVKKQSDAEKARKEKEKAKLDEEQLDIELGKVKAGASGSAAGPSGGDRDKKVKKAWEMVKDGQSSNPVSGADSRGVMDADAVAGQALPSGQSRPPVKQTAYDPTTSTEPLPPSMRNPVSTSTSSPVDTHSPTFRASESAPVSRHSATTSQAWEEVSPPSSAADQATPPEEDDLVRVSHPYSRSQRPAASGSGGGGGSGPPAHPPSLTLSLFTMPSHLSFSRALAVLGINLVLPFVNGVMLGFGEIFAREAITVGRIWWMAGGNFWRMLFSGRDDRPYSTIRGVGSVGLSGSRQYQ